MRPCGYIQDHPDITHPDADLLLGAFGTSTPDSVDLEPFAPPVFDQNTTSSCTGHGTATAIQIALAGKSVFIPSPRGIYAVGRAVSRRSPIDALTDEGAMPDSVVRGISTWGVWPMGPTGAAYSDVNARNVNVEPSLGELETASRSLVVGAHTIQPIGDRRVEGARQALAAGYPVCVGVYVDTQFEKWKRGDPPVGTPNFTDPNGGSHWVCVVGYSTVGGVTIFKVRNSWGVEFGDGGNILGNEDFMRAAYQAFVFSVTESAQ